MMIKNSGPTQKHKTWRNIKDMIVWKSALFLNEKFNREICQFSLKLITHLCSFNQNP